MRAMGVTAQVIVRAVDLRAYQESYPEIPDVNGLFVGFADEAEVLSLSRNFDVVVATHYRSMAILRRIVDAAPWVLPAYYTQDYEPLFEPEGTKHYWEAWHSYTAIPNMLLFAKTDWIRNQIEKVHGVKVEKVVPSIDHSVYFPTSEKRTEKVIRISAMIRPSTPRRGAERTMRLLKRLWEGYPEKVSITIFGCRASDASFLALTRDFSFENRGVLKRFEVADLLRHTDIFIDLSDYQAFGRTALEAMACGATAMVPRCGGSDEYAIDGHNALVVDTMNIDECFERVREVVESPLTLGRMKFHALSTAGLYSPRRAALSELLVFARAYAQRLQFISAEARSEAGSDRNKTYHAGTEERDD